MRQAIGDGRRTHAGRRPVDRPRAGRSTTLHHGDSGDAPAVAIGILGELTVQVAGVSVSVPGSKQRLLLAALTLNAGNLVTVDELITRLWDEQPPPSARTTLRGHVRRLRDLMRDPARVDVPAIQSGVGGYRLSGESTIDLEQFRRLRREASNGTDVGRQADLLSHALDLWRDVPLSGVETIGWVDQAVVALQEEYLETVERRCDLLLDRRETGSIVIELQRLLARHPLRESLWYRLILALHLGSRTAEALSRYDDVRRLLAEQLGIAPSYQLRSLHQRLLTEDLTATPPVIAAHG